MNNDIHVQGKIEKDVQESSAAEMVQLQADLREVQQLIDAFGKLSESFEWQTFMRVLVTPAIEKEKKTIEALNKDIINKPKALEELIYHNAFAGMLEKFTDLPELRKHFLLKSEGLRKRLKTLESKRK